MYQIIRITRTHHGSMTITNEKTIKCAATQADVDQILALPESYDGEREEAVEELSSSVITCYHHYMISEY